MWKVKNKKFVLEAAFLFRGQASHEKIGEMLLDSL